MLRVLLVDDEPFIVQGLAALINWEKEGYEIVATANNGVEALQYLQAHQVDLIIADINMPVMSGLTLLDEIRRSKISNAYFVILSGYNDFEYMQQAIRGECMDYILKPIQPQELMNILTKVANHHKVSQDNKRERQRRDRSYLSRNIITLLIGKYDEANLNYVREHLHLDKDIRYINIDINESEMVSTFSDSAKRAMQKRIYEKCMAYLGEKYCNYCIFDIINQDRGYDIGILYCSEMAREKALSDEEYLEELLACINKEIDVSAIMFVGSIISDLSYIADSYRSTVVIKAFQSLPTEQSIYYYTEQKGKNISTTALCKDILNELIKEIYKNDQSGIREKVDCLYDKMRQINMSIETIELNINYLLFKLVNIATEQEPNVNQEEIMRKIGLSAFDGITRCGSRKYFKQFAEECATYLMQLRNDSSGGVLIEVEKEIHHHYKENLTLKGLSKKYYVNSAYLGQLFIKKYGVPFKDYLNNYRIEQAVELLLHTEYLVYEIAEKVGYKSLDYFINRFIMVKGCTPTKYRKQLLDKE